MLDVKGLLVKGGMGGNGAVSFLHEKFRPNGGPDGGDGGVGGNVVVVAQRERATLSHLLRMREILAEDGGNGSGHDRTGKKGKSRSIVVPVGTVVWSVSADGEKVMLVTRGAKVVVARGGDSGRGNHRFVTSINQEPLLAEAGEMGEERAIVLEVKLLADVGIVGAPNAGKSTLLGAVTRAKPKVASYPFTTIEPVLGVAEHRGRQMLLLDVPGLIEGAHEGRGLGLEFLRHVERVQALVQMVDGSEEDVAGEYRRIRAELEAYPGGLMGKPTLVVLNKVDIPEVRAELDEKTAALAEASGEKPMVISGASGEGLDRLLDALLGFVPELSADGAEDEELPDEEPDEPTVRAKRERVTIEMDGEIFVVHCRQAERFAPTVSFGNWRSKMQFHGELERLGVITALGKAGVTEGATVRIAGRELEWE
jgi:GTP-binding protein